MQAVEPQDFRALVEHHPRAIMLSTTEPRIAYVNRSFQAVTGYCQDEVLGEPPSVLSSGLHSWDFYRGMWESIHTNGRWEGLIWNRRKNGETYPQWLSIYPVVQGARKFYAGVFMDVGDPAAGDERLASLAYYDPLTELPNRSLFQEFLRARVDRRQGAVACFGVLFIDLDFFKSINDLHGHDCGDQVLKAAARCIRSALRRNDVLARLSGDEFAAIVEVENDLELENIGERLNRAFQDPVRVDGREYFLSASVGGAMFPDHGRTSADLLQNADRAMYTAKVAGRACFRLYSAVESEQGRREQRLSEALIAALKTAPEQFRVVYQPQFDLATGRVVGLEALFRWLHPEFGEISPADFIPIAEHRGHIHDLTEHLLRCVQSDLDSVSGEQMPHGLRLAINISARQITDTRLDQVLGPFFDRLAALGWRPELEITETHLMSLSSRCLQRLRRFGEQGVGVAIDDFGTGYSSLAYLHTLPVQVLKIDRQFTRQLGTDARDARIVSAILGIAEALGLEVVAEGIESEEQLEKLRQLRCHRGQGYLLGKPVGWSQIVAVLIDGHQFQYDFVAS
ncbi:PAS domain S-box-containing protein/diguanylate cyclase (GGDEF)-like protein [Marinobacter pelagius]|uniref:PAS domain S-box-containing protein/diguanylate cyclase (GGDEF)-like protein n=1 Tax=Marinobacter pelagius TaxID=379482 RepID=A0A366GYV0_9GAMM|nr:GGDEF and EAL domain-containing protein [Marinobacter pelagius]RBP33293.1 PAS domain S-box-containing protein/diguanylate cyclase (GGDEF)-like protein [Marinobacter pelagius]